jgi:hypothetical protein
MASPRLDRACLEPFDLDRIGKAEAAYYLYKSNRYGCPMDERHTYVSRNNLVRRDRYSQQLI